MEVAPCRLDSLLPSGARMREWWPYRGRRLAERREQHHLPGGVGDVVLAADDVGDLHARVVHDHGEVVGVAAVGALDDEVADDVGREGDGPVDEVVEDDVALAAP